MTNAPEPTGPVRDDRSVGTVVASACGDALGAGYEFGPAMADDAPVEMIGGGGFGWRPGEWTDDTQMTTCILEELAAGSADVAAIGDRFLEWFHSGPADVGIQTRSVLSSGAPLERAAADYASARPDNSAGNGSLMRTAPVALAAPGQPDRIAELARAVSALTHADRDCQDACVLWSVAIDHAIHHAPGATGAWSFADAIRIGLDHLPADRRDRWAALISEAETGSPRRFTRNGWVVHAFQAALGAACATPVPDGDDAPQHLRLALEAAVRIGGDTDTVAAIAGALLGARWGATAVPGRWMELLNGRTARPAPIRDAHDLSAWSRLAARGGSPDAHGWPGRPRMVEHYLTLPDRPSGRHAELHGVRFGDVVTLGAVLDEVDVVVSLCRMGTEDVPGDTTHVVVGLVDTDDNDNPNLVHVLEETADTIERHRSAGSRVFVHCVAAQNRTPTVAAAWLVRHRGQGHQRAIDVAGDELNPPREFLRNAVHRVRPADRAAATPTT